MDSWHPSQTRPDPQDYHPPEAAYVDSVVKRFNFSSASPPSTPIDHNILLSTEKSPSTPQQIGDERKVPYCEAIGSLMYAAIGT